MIFLFVKNFFINQAFASVFRAMLYCTCFMHNFLNLLRYCNNVTGYICISQTSRTAAGPPNPIHGALSIEKFRNQLSHIKYIIHAWRKVPTLVSSGLRPRHTT
jgi:hypothetical protein